ncbi:unnamed protein product [Onchocerca flexuosa]|uniref:Secreted protein n=1 Tax=Onchocerca flexuosa TaxID=387005 RepID=A0A183HAP4_9BILA|nr:unnamed protein product [Onchocerca flexuosa]
MSRKLQPAVLIATIDPTRSNTSGSNSILQQHLHRISTNDRFIIHRRFPRTVRKTKLRVRLGGVTIAISRKLRLASKNWKNCRSGSEIRFLQLRAIFLMILK